MNDKAKAEKKIEEAQDKAWGEPSKVFLPSASQNQKPATTKKADLNLPANIKELVLVVQYLCDNLETQSAAVLKEMKKRANKALKPYNL